MNISDLICVQQRLLNNRQLFDLEITTRCNKNCYMCPRSNFIRRNQDMRLETFEKIVEWLPIDCDVFLAGYGEPLLHKDCIQFISKLSKKGISTSVLTNGILLSENYIQNLFDAGLERLQISIIMRNETDNIRHYSEMAKKCKHGFIRFNLIYDEAAQISETINKSLTEQGFEFSYKKIHNRANELYEADYIEDILSCGTFFSTTYIDTQGNLQICSNDINGKYNQGNVNNMTFQQLIEKKKYHFGNSSISPICNHCIDEYRLIHFSDYDK